MPHLIEEHRRQEEYKKARVIVQGWFDRLPEGDKVALRLRFGTGDVWELMEQNGLAAKEAVEALVLRQAMHKGGSE